MNTNSELQVSTGLRTHILLKCLVPQLNGFPIRKSNVDLSKVWKVQGVPRAVLSISYSYFNSISHFLLSPGTSSSRPHCTKPTRACLKARTDCCRWEISKVFQYFHPFLPGKVDLWVKVEESLRKDKRQVRLVKSPGQEELLLTKQGGWR